MNELVTNLSVIAEDDSDRYPAHVKKLAEAAASRIAALEAQLAERAGGVNEDALRALAQAYDREDAAQRGEPDPWNLDDPGDIGDSDTWVSERLACARAAAEAFLSALTSTGAVAWRDAAVSPEIPKGTERNFIVAVRRARNGKVYSFPAAYLNAYPLRFEYECPKGDGCEGNGCEDGCPTTGWYSATGDGNDGLTYEALYLEKDDEFLGWREVPQWEAVLTHPPAQAGAVTEAMVEAAAKSLRPDLFTPIKADVLQSDDYALTCRRNAKIDVMGKARAALTAAIGAGGQAVAWRISCPDDEIYGRGPDTLRFHPLSSDEIAFGYTQQPLFTHPAPSGQAVKRGDLLPAISAWATDADLALTIGDADDLAGRILSALVASRMPVGEGSAAPSGCAFDNDHLAWACERWQREVASRPLRNAHRRTLDDTWRQVIRRLGGDPDILLPMADHDTLVARAGEDGR